MLLHMCVLIATQCLFYYTAADFVPPSKPDYSQLEKFDKSKLPEQAEFKAAVEKMAGYYSDPTKNPALAKTIVMAGINYSYRDFYHNFKCFTEKLGIKFLPISLDPQIYEYLKATENVPTFLMPDIPGRDKVPTEASGFGGKPFNLIGCRKLEAVGGALALGYDVIFSDVDIALLHDPIDHLFFPEVDYVHSENNGCNTKWKFNDTMEGNTGFYAVRSNPATIREWDLSYRLCARNPLYDDQTMYWLILRTNQNPVAAPRTKCPSVKKGGAIAAVQNKAVESTSRNFSSIVTCPLDNCLFSASMLQNPDKRMKLQKALKDKKQPAYMIHANWMNGREKKKAALSSAGLWMVTPPAGMEDMSPSVRKQVKVQNMGITGNWTCRKALAGPFANAVASIGLETNHPK